MSKQWTFEESLICWKHMRFPLSFAGSKKQKNCFDKRMMNGGQGVFRSSKKPRNQCLEAEIWTSYGVNILFIYLCPCGEGEENGLPPFEITHPDGREAGNKFSWSRDTLLVPGFIVIYVPYKLPPSEAGNKVHFQRKKLSRSRGPFLTGNSPITASHELHSSANTLARTRPFRDPAHLLIVNCLSGINPENPRIFLEIPGFSWKSQEQILGLSRIPGKCPGSLWRIPEIPGHIEHWWKFLGFYGTSWDFLELPGTLRIFTWEGPAEKNRCYWDLLTRTKWVREYGSRYRTRQFHPSPVCSD